MKTLTFILLWLPVIMVSQSNYPLVKDGAIWREEVGFLNTSNDKLQFLMQGDTLLYGKTYKKVYKTNYDSIITSKNYFGAMREDSLSRVYFIIDSVNATYSDFYFPSEFTDTAEVLLYDFNVGVGDTVYVPNQYDSLNIIDDIDSLLINGEYRKRYRVKGSYWIEGIGSVKGLFFPAFYEDENMNWLVCYEDSNILWDNPELAGGCYDVGVENQESQVAALSIYPNPANSRLNLVFEKTTIQTVQVFNIAGQRIFSEEIEEKQFSIDVSDWNAGLYFVKLRTHAGVRTQKVVVTDR